jgi:hypothetical protein
MHRVLSGQIRTPKELDGTLTFKIGGYIQEVFQMFLHFIMAYTRIITKITHKN